LPEAAQEASSPQRDQPERAGQSPLAERAAPEEKGRGALSASRESLQQDWEARRRRREIIGHFGALSSAALAPQTVAS